MKWVLNVAIIFFSLLFIFNIFQLNFNDTLFSEKNEIFLYSGMFAIIGFLLTLILLLVRKLYFSTTSVK